MFLDKCAASQAPHHRATRRFLAGDLRQAMEAWAAGEPVTSELRVELDSYQWCMLDDTWAEATHRGVARVCQRATFASQAWQSATLRLRQNLQLWDALDTRGRAGFQSCFYKWKAIGQLSPQRLVKLIAVKTSPKTVTQFVYRTGTHALKDWNTQLQDVLKSSIRADVLPPGTLASRLQVDYLERVLAPGALFQPAQCTVCGRHRGIGGHGVARGGSFAARRCRGHAFHAAG